MRNLLIAAATAAAALPAAALAQAQTSTDSALISFSISEEVKSTPDRAGIGAGVTTSGATAIDALRANSLAMEKLIAAAKKAGIKPQDIQTSGISLSPQYDYRPQEQGQAPRLTGYQVSNSVRVGTSNIAGIGGLIDTMVAAGGTNIDGPWFSVADPDAQLGKARSAVVAKANARAADYARLTGYREARLVTLSEGGGMAAPMSMPMMAMADAGVMKVAPPVEPGQIGNTLTITVQYRLVK